MDKQYLRYSVNGSTFMFCKGEMVANNLYGNLEVISEEHYNKAIEVMGSYTGVFQIIPTMITSADKVMNGFDEKSLIGYQVGHVKYLWVWKDNIGNIWAEATMQSAPMQGKVELVN